MSGLLKAHTEWPDDRANLVAERDRLREEKRELVKALEAISTRVIDCYSDCPPSVRDLAEEARIRLARVNAKEKI